MPLRYFRVPARFALIGNPGNDAYHYNCFLFIITPPVTECARDAEGSRMRKEGLVEET